MRSRNVSPGFAVMRTTIVSESTRVPPVTALRSPPASRMTGADSPVIADSSTDRGAFDDVAVGRDELAGLDAHEVAFAELRRADHLDRVSPTTRLRRASRSSCAASSRLAPCRALRPPPRRSSRRRTVNQSQSEIAKSKPTRPLAAPRIAHAKTSVTSAPTSHDEHDRIAHLPARIELLERVDRSPGDDRAVEQRRAVGVASCVATALERLSLAASGGARRSVRARRPGRTSARRR